MPSLTTSNADTRRKRLFFWAMIGLAVASIYVIASISGFIMDMENRTIKLPPDLILISKSFDKGIPIDIPPTWTYTYSTKLERGEVAKRITDMLASQKYDCNPRAEARTSSYSCISPGHVIYISLNPQIEESDAEPVGPPDNVSINIQ